MKPQVLTCGRILLQAIGLQVKTTPRVLLRSEKVLHSGRCSLDLIKNVLLELLKWRNLRLGFYLNLNSVLT